MKIVELRLTAFGPFTDVNLSFGNSPNGLSIVYGPNEAGKSSALRAVTQLLFGMPHLSADNFLHRNDQLCIGAVIRDQRGRELSFTRRKGTKNTLRSEDGRPFDEQVLRGFLGAIDRATFETMFGIDHATLVRGGREIATGGGDSGPMLFAAAAGIGHLRRILQDLERQQRDLFLAGGRKPRINQMLSSLSVLRKRIRESSLPSEEWQKHHQALDRANREKRQLDKHLRSHERELNRLQRIHNALPDVSKRKKLLESQAHLAEVVLLPEDFSARRTRCQEELAVALSRIDQAQKDIARLRQGIAGIRVDSSLLRQGDNINELHQRLGSHRKAMFDRSGLVREVEQMEAEARDLLRRLDRHLPLEQADSLRLKPEQQARIRRLGTEFTGLTTRCQDDRKRARHLRNETERLQNQLKHTADPVPPDTLKTTLQRAEQAGPLEQQLTRLKADLDRDEQVAAVDLNRLPLFEGTLEELERLPVPSPESVDQFKTSFERYSLLLQQQHDTLRQLEQSIWDKSREIDRLRMEGDVPSEEDLKHWRRRRDEGWRLVRQAWLKGGAETPALEQFLADFAASELADAYEAAVRRADELADRLRREASRVASHAQLQADLRSLQQRLDAERAELNRLTNEAERLNADWKSLWQRAGIVPQSPSEMIPWLRQHHSLVELAGRLRQQRSALAHVQAQIQVHRKDIEAALKELGETVPPLEASFTAVLDHARKVVASREEAIQERDQLRTELNRRLRDLSDAERQLNQSQQALAKWKTRWAEAIAPLHLAEDTTPDEANAVLDVHTDLFQKLRDIAGKRERIQGIDCDRDQFEADVTAMVSQVAKDLASLRIEQAAEELHARWLDAQKDNQKHQDLTRELEQKEKTLETERSRAQELQAQLQAMCAEAGCDTPEQLAAAEQQSALRRQVESDLEEVEGRLVRYCAGAPLDEFIAEVEAVDADTIEPRLATLNQDIRSLKETLAEINKTIGRETAILSRLDGNATASQAAEEYQHLLAELSTQVERYATLWLARRVLDESIRRYREQSQGSVLERAGQLFSQLTCRSFTGLQVDWDDKGNEVVVGVRAGGSERVQVAGMSDGTCDQLYLALRLATLEQYYDHHEPVPLIVDDILINFDDDRAAAALRCLADLGRRSQIIFFTHHQHLVQLAEATLDRQDFDLQELSPAKQTTPRPA